MIFQTLCPMRQKGEGTVAFESCSVARGQSWLRPVSRAPRLKCMKLLIDLKFSNCYPILSVNRSLVSALLVFFLALGLAGTQALAFWVVSAHAGEEDAAGDAHEQQAVRRRISSRPPGKKIQVTDFFNAQGSSLGIVRSLQTSHPLPQSGFYPGHFHLLPVFQV